MYGVGSSTIGRAIGEIRPPLAERGFAVPQRPGLRPRTLADVFAYAEAENVTLRIDGTETQVRRPKAGRPGRAAFVSGKRKQNIDQDHPSATAKDAPCGAGRCGRAGCTTRPRCAPRASLSSSGSEFPDQVSAPPRKPKNLGEGAITEQYGWRQAKRRQSSQRIAVEHATPNCVNGAPCSAGQDAARTTPRHTARSPAWALTAPPNEPPATGQRRCASRRRRSPLHFCQARALPIMVAWRIEVSLRAAQRSDTGCRCSHRGDSWRTPDGSRRRSEGGNRA